MDSDRDKETRMVNICTPRMKPCIVNQLPFEAYKGVNEQPKSDWPYIFPQPRLAEPAPSCVAKHYR